METKCSVLKNAKFLKDASKRNKTILSTKYEIHTTMRTVWDVSKAYFRGLAISYIASQTKTRKHFKIVESLKKKESLKKIPQMTI